MKLVDTHCHIHEAEAIIKGSDIHKQWQAAGLTDPDQMITEASQAGVSSIMCIGTDLSDSQRAIDFVQNRDTCWATIGIHPHETKDYVGKLSLLEQFIGLVSQPKVVAIGECGLDYFYEHSSRAAQIKVLKFQIELAQKHNLPLVFHVREAFDDFWSIFESYQSDSQPIRGVLHSFTDSTSNLERAIKHGLYIGVNGIATFTKQPMQLSVYKAIPNKNLLLETDAPFLTPTPFRGTINVPKYVRVVAEFLSELRGESLENLTEFTTANALKLFGLK